jgi:hypothetical protein
MKIYDNLTVEQEEKGIIEEIREITNSLGCSIIFESSALKLFSAQTKQVVCVLDYLGRTSYIEESFFQNKDRLLRELKDYLFRNMGAEDAIMMKSALKDLTLFKWYTQLYNLPSIIEFRETLIFLLNAIDDVKAESKLSEAIDYLNTLIPKKKQTNIVEFPQLAFEYNK